MKTLPQSKNVTLDTLDTFAQGSIPLQENEVRSPFNIPILAFVPKLAADGLPMLSEWMTTAGSIWATQYEGWREPFEIKALEGIHLAGKSLCFGCLEVVKGCGRLSILLYSLFWTYLKLKNVMINEDMVAFRSYLGIVKSFTFFGV